jgi:hypothetical protein
LQVRINARIFAAGLLALAAARALEPPAASPSPVALPDPLAGAWQDTKNPERRIAFRAGKLWVAEKGRLLRALPILAADGGHLWTCWRDGSRRAIDAVADADGHTLTLKGLEEGSYRRLDALPAELDLQPLAWPPPRPLPGERARAIQLELARRSRYVKLPISSPKEAEKSKVEEVDRDNASYLRKLAAEVGWIDEARFGREAALAALRIVDHGGDLPLALTALSEIRKEIDEHTRAAYGDPYARLYDQLHLAIGGVQRYGTQKAIRPDRSEVVRPLEDPAHADERRGELGLPPLGDSTYRGGDGGDPIILNARCEPVAR